MGAFALFGAIVILFLSSLGFVGVSSVLCRKNSSCRYNEDGQVLITPTDKRVIQGVCAATFFLLPAFYLTIWKAANTKRAIMQLEKRKQGSVVPVLEQS